MQYCDIVFPFLGKSVDSDRISIGERNPVIWGSGLYYLFLTWGPDRCEEMLLRYRPYIFLGKIDWVKVFERDDKIFKHSGADLNSSFLYWLFCKNGICNNSIEYFKFILEKYFYSKENIHPVGYAIANKLRGVLNFLVRGLQYSLGDSDYNGKSLLSYVMTLGDVTDYDLMQRKAVWRNEKVFNFIVEHYRQPMDIQWEDILLFTRQSPLPCFYGHQAWLLDFLNWLEAVSARRFQIKNEWDIAIKALSFELYDVAEWLVTDPHAVDKHGNTLLHYASCFNRANAIAWCMMQSQSAKNTYNNLGKSPRMMAVMYNNEKNYDEAIKRLETTAAYLFNCLFWMLDFILSIWEKIQLLFCNQPSSVVSFNVPTLSSTVFDDTAKESGKVAPIQKTVKKSISMPIMTTD